MPTLLLEDALPLPQYDELIPDLINQHYAVRDAFLAPEEVQELKARLLELKAQQEFKQAGIGKAQNFTLDRQIRGDYIHWIETDVAKPVTLLFLHKIQALRHCLNRHLFLSLKDHESHFAYYPVGTAYQRHLDQFHNNRHRKISFVCYLNSNWQVEDGGQLRLYLDKAQTQDILPEAGRLVCFKSDTLEHEVLRAQRERYSITGWFLDQFNDLTFLP